MTTAPDKIKAVIQQCCDPGGHGVISLDAMLDALSLPDAEALSILRSSDACFVKYHEVIDFLFRDTKSSPAEGPTSSGRKEKLAVIGSGNFGSALTRILGRNAQAHEVFDDEVKMWVYEEEWNGGKLTDAINANNENVKYLPGAKFTPNVVATASLADAVSDATMLAFCIPHQFLKPNLGTIRDGIAGRNVKGLSAIKGIDFNESGLVLISDLIRRDVGIDIAVLMGANVANEMASDAFCETTIGYSNKDDGELWKLAFNCPSFQVGLVPDTVAPELCGALKNIVAIGAGFCDGLGYGGNTKAAVIRVGLKEIIKFCKTFYTGISDETFLESCGVADLITTCFGGRNRKCAEAFATAGGKKSLEEIEAELLGGQKLQGTLTAKEVNHVLKMKEMEHEFPLFTTVYKISYEGQALETITTTITTTTAEKISPVDKIMGS